MRLLRAMVKTQVATVARSGSKASALRHSSSMTSWATSSAAAESAPSRIA